LEHSSDSIRTAKAPAGALKREGYRANQYLEQYLEQYKALIARGLLFVIARSDAGYFQPEP
jgi:hypothetical protein